MTVEKVITINLSPIQGKLLSSAVITSVVFLSTWLYIRPVLNNKKKPHGRVSRAPKAVELPEPENSKQPYPPNVLPCGRGVPTSYGTLKVFEWGPEEGEKALLLHGIGTPCLALGDMASGLVAKGYRVMLFDFFGRGYSDAPTDLPYDDRLYTTQILLALASSPLPWTGTSSFHLLGYSLGGAIAASFAAYHPHLLKSLTLICPGGLIRAKHLSWQNKLLYSEGLFPEWLLRTLVAERLYPQSRKEVPDKPEAEVVLGAKVRETADFDGAILSKTRPGVTVADVLAWQLEYHPGFVPAYMSTIRLAPIYGQGERDWRLLSEQLEARRQGGKVPPGLEGGKVLFILGKSDSVIIKDEIEEDARRILGDGMEVVVLEGGHEIAISDGEAIANTVSGVWGKTTAKQIP